MDTFSDRFRQEFRAGVAATTAVHRRTAAKVLKGVAWQFIPVFTLSRRPFVAIEDLAMLCSCLDDEEVAAKPGRVTADQLVLAWRAAGHHQWLVRRTRHRMLEQAWLASSRLDELEYHLRRAASAINAQP